MFKWISVVWKNLVPGESPVRLWLPPHTELCHLPPISHQAGAVLALSPELWGSGVKLKIELCSRCNHVSSVIQARPDAVQRWSPSKSEVGEKWPGTEEVDCDISRGELSCGLWRSCVREPGARTPPPSNVQLVGEIKWGGYEDKNTKTKTKTGANTGQAWRRFWEGHASGLCPLVMWSPRKPRADGGVLRGEPSTWSDFWEWWCCELRIEKHVPSEPCCKGRGALEGQGLRETIAPSESNGRSEI